MTRRQLELDQRFRSAGLTAILGMGSAPGKTNLLARTGDRSASGDRLARDLGGHARPRGGGPSPAHHVLRADPAGRAAVAPGSAARRRARRGGTALWRGAARAARVGEVDGIYTLHSELATLPSSFPSLREASFRLSLSPGLVEKLLALGDERPEPYVQSAESVAVHFVEPTASAQAAITRGGSARSTASRLRGGRGARGGAISAPGVHPPEAAVQRSQRIPRDARHRGRCRYAAGWPFRGALRRDPLLQRGPALGAHDHGVAHVVAAVLAAVPEELGVDDRLLRLRQRDPHLGVLVELLLPDDERARGIVRQLVPDSARPTPRTPG